jgi:hypothetical protein
MQRIVWIGAALLIIVAIMSYATFVMKDIERVNEERRQKDAAKDIAVQIAATTATTSVWDLLRATETTTGESGQEATIMTAGLDDQPADGNVEPTGSPEEDAPEAPSDFAEPDVATEQTTVMTIYIN